MARINNTKVFGLENACRAARYPMVADMRNDVPDDISVLEKLAKCKTGTGHDNALNGIIVQFDLTFSNKAWVELQRYHFIDFISSQSTMHCISKMPTSEQCNNYVTDNTKAELIRLKLEYLNNKTDENYLRLLYNIPSGFELTAGMTTNYRQLKTIYQQRRHHRLPDWQVFCDWIEDLPHSELITGRYE